jgi:hypothetical protein
MREDPVHMAARQVFGDNFRFAMTNGGKVEVGLSAELPSKTKYLLPEGSIEAVKKDDNPSSEYFLYRVDEKALLLVAERSKTVHRKQFP